MSSPSVRRAQAALRRAIAPAAAIALALAPVSAHAQDTPGKTVLLRDAETEQLLRDYAAPIFRAAGIDAKAIEIILINDLSLNAFVANGRKIFINLGALMEAETPNEIVGVIAHETGHIAGGHLARLRDQIANAKILSVAGMLLGAGAVAGAMRSGDKVGEFGHRRRRRHDGRPGADPAQPPVLPALRGAGRRSGRRALSQGHRSSRPRACSRPSGALPRAACSARRRSTPTS